MEVVRQLREGGTTSEVIYKLKGAASEGHKSSQYFMAILYHVAEEEIFCQQARDMIWNFRMRLERKGMRILTRTMKGWLTHHIRCGGVIFHMANYVPCPNGYSPPFMSNRGRKDQRRDLCKTCYVNKVFKYLHEHMMRQWPGLNVIFQYP